MKFKAFVAITIVASASLAALFFFSHKKPAAVLDEVKLQGAISDTTKASVAKTVLDEKGARISRVQAGYVHDSGAPSGVPPTRQKISSTKPLPKKDEKVLKFRPASLTLSAQEGQAIKAEAELINTGNKTLYVNIYKSLANSSRVDLAARIKELAAFKERVTAEQAQLSVPDLKGCVLLTGASWLMPFPFMAALEPGKSLRVQVTVDARQLDARADTAHVIVMGMNKKEVAVLPVYVQVALAPKIKVSRLTVDDGLTAGTRGNSDTVVQAGEYAQVSVYIKNTGSWDAQGLRIAVIPDDPRLRIIGEAVFDFSVLRQNEEIPLSFFAEVLPGGNETIPPSITIAADDEDGKKWEENFYLGDPDKIQYPTGLQQDKTGGAQ